MNRYFTAYFTSMSAKQTAKRIVNVGIGASLVGAIGLCLLPLASHAQPAPSDSPGSPDQPGMMSPAGGASFGHRHPFPEFEGVNLTPEQQQQVQQIRQDMRSQFEATRPPRPQLTPEQRSKLEAGEPIQITITPPTPEQRQQMQHVMETYRQRVEAVLTPEQRKQFEQNQSRHRQMMPHQP
jgi:Spy/CpxP family protein refolding chaperone